MLGTAAAAEEEDAAGAAEAKAMPTVDDAEGASMVSSLLAFPVCRPREPAVQLLAVHLTVHTNGSPADAVKAKQWKGK